MFSSKINNLILASFIICVATLGLSAHGQTASDKQVVINALKKQLPGVNGITKINVSSLKADPAKRVLTAQVSEAVTYIPFTAESMDAFKKDVLSQLGDKYNDYTLKLQYTIRDKQGNVQEVRDLDDLVLFAPKKNVGPTEQTPFIRDLGAQPVTKGLEGTNIALWQSHGWYFEPKLNRWEWQRARIFQTVEDLYPQSYIIPFLMPMLRNAGAYVMSPRERDINTIEIIADNDGGLATGLYAETGDWTTTANPGFAFTKAQLHEKDYPFSDGTARMTSVTTDPEKATKATWSADFPEAGEYAVYVSYQTLPNSATDALYTINSKSGPRQFKVNQNMGGGTWIYLGHFDFDKGTPSLPVVELTNLGSDTNTVVTADAVKIGGGMGNVARRVSDKVGEPGMEYQYVSSQYPRFTEGARYWLQWAGAPDSVFTPTGNVNDYNDDYRSRGEWVNWLAGGSSMLPNRKGLNIPVDLSFAFHTDAGTTMNDSIIGTLGIYCTAGQTLGNGSSRNASRDFTDLIMTNIVDDVRAKFEPNWTRRGMWDKSYYEARVPQVPGMLLEFLSHQNFADMKYGLDPAFRFWVSRAIYKGMLKFIAQRDGREYVVQPLPVRAYAINATGNHSYKLTWQPTTDTTEPTAMPTSYIIEERIGDGAFKFKDRVQTAEYTVTVTDSDIHSYRVIADNDGGVAFPSEVLALCEVPGSTSTVNIVNGFTRVSAPDTFDSGEIAGFYDTRDHGVPYVNDISYIGTQFEFRRDIPWMDDDAAGFGASRANYETKVIAGNTFDYVYTHGQAIAKAGHSFVSTSVEAFENSTSSAGEPAIIDLILGKQKEIKQGRGAYGTRFKTFPTALQNRLAAFTAGGGSVFVSGSFVATDLWDNPNSSPEVAKADQKFATEVLGYHWRVGQASCTGEAYQVQSRFKAFTGGEYDFSASLNKELYAVESPDSFYPADTKRGATIMRYTENNLVAGTAFDAGNYRTVVIGFPFETITSSAQRDSLMSQVLNFLSQSKSAKLPVPVAKNAATKKKRK